MGDMNFSLTTFDKSGKLLQIEYALNRVQQGKMALGVKGILIKIYYLEISFINLFCLIVAKNGVVIACDKKVNSVLVDTADYVKIQSITPTTGI